MGELQAIAQNRWPGILSALGVPDEHLTGKHGPCPFCGGKDRWRFTDHEGKGLWICNQCGAGDGADLLMRYHGWDFKQTASEVRKVVGEVEPTFKPSGPDPSIRLNQIRRGAYPAGGSAEVIDYLTSRGLEVPNTLKAHDAVAYYQDKSHIGDFSAMLGLVVDRGGKPVTYHVTYLKDGKKVPLEPARKILKPTRSVNGCSIRLYPADVHMGVAEGIETAIAAHMLTGLPVWSVMSTSGMEHWFPPEGTDAVTVFADNDVKYGGQKAAYELAHKLRCKGFDVEVKIPPRAGQDFNDVLLESADAA